MRNFHLPSIQEVPGRREETGAINIGPEDQSQLIGVFIGTQTF
jgi:hypothetical protein